MASVNQEGRRENRGGSVAAVRETWEPETTANNLRMIERSRNARGDDTAWLLQVVAELEARAGK